MIRASALVAIATMCSMSAAVGPSAKTVRYSGHAHAQSAKAGNKNPGIAPPQSHSHGRTYGEWSAAWWQWVLAIPGDRNPLTDPDGRFCGEQQGGPVWFIAGTFGTSAERLCPVPPGRAIFLPIFNWIFGAGAFDCDPSVPGVPCNVTALRETAAANTELARILEVTIDGVAVQNVRQYRAKSPLPFSLTYPENSVVGLPSGTYYPQISDGYWLMLNPMKPGHHIIDVRVYAPGTIVGDIEFRIIHRILVQ